MSSNITSNDQLQRECDGWEESAAQFCRNADYYRGLVDQIGKLLGDEAYIADDGTRSEDVLRAKVPELVAARLRAHETTDNPFDHAAIMGDPGNHRISMSFEKREHYEAALVFLDMADEPVRRPEETLCDPLIVTAKESESALAFRHWSKDPAVPYPGCHCGTCQQQQKASAVPGGAGVPGLNTKYEDI